MSIERLQRLWSTILILFWQNLFSQISSLILLLTNTIRNRHWNIQTYTDHITEDFHHLMLCSFKVHLYILLKSKSVFTQMTIIFSTNFTILINTLVLKVTFTIFCLNRIKTGIAILVFTISAVFRTWETLIITQTKPIQTIITLYLVTTFRYRIWFTIFHNIWFIQWFTFIIII